MTLNKWGDRVQSLLNEKQGEAQARKEDTEALLSPAELVSRTARRLEIEQETEEIRTWIKARKPRVLRDALVIVKYAPKMAWYEVDLRMAVGGKSFVAKGQIRDEDIDESTQSLTTWSRYMDDFLKNMLTSLAAQLRTGGLDTLAKAVVGHHAGGITWERVGSSYSTSSNGAALNALSASTRRASDQFDAMRQSLNGLSSSITSNSFANAFKVQSEAEALSRRLADEAEQKEAINSISAAIVKQGREK